MHPGVRGDEPVVNVDPDIVLADGIEDVGTGVRDREEGGEAGGEEPRIILEAVIRPLEGYELDLRSDMNGNP